MSLKVLKKNKNNLLYIILDRFVFMSRGMGSNLTSKIYKLLDFVYFFLTFISFCFQILKKKKNKKKNTTVIPTTTKCYARVLGEAVQIQNSWAQRKHWGITGDCAWININTPAATATITTTVYESWHFCLLISTEFRWLSEAPSGLFPKLSYLSVFRKQLFMDSHR